MVNEKWPESPNALSPTLDSQSDLCGSPGPARAADFRFLTTPSCQLQLSVQINCQLFCQQNQSFMRTISSVIVGTCLG
jgi:hypothetical protein